MRPGGAPPISNASPMPPMGRRATPAPPSWRTAWRRWNAPPNAPIGGASMCCCRHCARALPRCRDACSSSSESSTMIRRGEHRDRAFLVVDDEGFSRDLLRHMLGELDVGRIDGASCGAEALELL